jgi:hypothetical protein
VAGRRLAAGARLTVPNLYFSVDLGAATGSRQGRIDNIRTKLATGLNGRFAPHQMFHYAASTDQTATVPGRYMLGQAEMTTTERDELIALFPGAIVWLGEALPDGRAPQTVYDHIAATAPRFFEPYP